jgi:hypothetical protein
MRIGSALPAKSDEALYLRMPEFPMRALPGAFLQHPASFLQISHYSRIFFGISSLLDHDGGSAGDGARTKTRAIYARLAPGHR